MGFMSNRNSFNRGVYHFSRGEYLESIEHYRKAVKRAPADNQAWNNLALSYYKLGKIKDAMKCLDEALMISPDDVYALTNKAALILADGRHGEARYVIDKVLMQDQDDVHALNLKGLALMKDEMYMEAHELFRRAAEIDPHYRHAVRNMARAQGRLSSISKDNLKGDGKEKLPEPGMAPLFTEDEDDDMIYEFDEDDVDWEE